MCGKWMRPVAESTQRGNSWARYMCPECLHEETVLLPDSAAEESISESEEQE